MSNEYSGYLICTNCSHKDDFKIRNGVTVEAFARQTPCPKCKCMTLRSFKDMLNPK